MEMIIHIFFGILGLCCFMCLLRIGRGPTAPDRTVAIDILGIVVVGFCALMAVLTGKDFYINIAIVWSLLSFIGTIALAKYLEGRGFDD
jgi:multicomponent Na+:H+ antiporter subunit F